MPSYLKFVDSQQNLDMDKPMFPISVVADILSVHQRTLRIYDTEEILVPKRSAKKRRLYSLNDIEKGKFIQYLTKCLGINISGIKVIMSLLAQLGISEQNYINYAKNIADKLNITIETQEENYVRFSKKGRKPSKEA